MYPKIKNFCRAPNMWIKHVIRMWIKQIQKCGSLDQTCDQNQKCGSFKNVDLSQIENMGGSHAVSYTGHASCEEAHDLMHHFGVFLFYLID